MDRYEPTMVGLFLGAAESLRNCSISLEYAYDWFVGIESRHRQIFGSGMTLGLHDACVEHIRAFCTESPTPCENSSRCASDCCGPELDSARAIGRTWAERAATSMFQRNRGRSDLERMPLHEIAVGLEPSLDEALIACGLVSPPSPKERSVRPCAAAATGPAADPSGRLRGSIDDLGGRMLLEFDDAEGRCLDAIREALASWRWEAGPFAVRVVGPLSYDSRGRICAVVQEAIRCRPGPAGSQATVEGSESARDPDGGKAAGGPGPRVVAGSSRRPLFVSSDGADSRLVIGLWARSDRFLVVPISTDGLSITGAEGRSSRQGWQPWVVVRHRQVMRPWLDDEFDALVRIDSDVLMQLALPDEDGDRPRLTILPAPTDAATAAAVIEEFLADLPLHGMEKHLLPLIAYGLPSDGSGPALAVEMTPDRWNDGIGFEGYECEILLAPPAGAGPMLLAQGHRSADQRRDLVLAFEEHFEEVTLDEFAHGATADRAELDESLETLDEPWRTIIRRLVDDDPVTVSEKGWPVSNGDR